MNPTKTFTPLLQLSIGNKPGQIKIEQCSEVLDNKSQCWKAADVYITSVIKTKVEDGTEVETVTSYQKCRRHALMEQEAYIKTLTTEEVKPINLES